MYNKGDLIKTSDGIMVVEWHLNGLVGTADGRVYSDKDVSLVQRAIFRERVNKPLSEMTDDELRKALEELRLMRTSALSGSSKTDRKKQVRKSTFKKKKEVNRDLEALAKFLDPEELEELKRRVEK